MTQQDQRCPSDSTSLGTSSKDHCSSSAAGKTDRETDEDLWYLNTPPVPAGPTLHRASYCL